MSNTTTGLGNTGLLHHPCPLRGKAKITTGGVKKGQRNRINHTGIIRFDKTAIQNTIAQGNGLKAAKMRVRRGDGTGPVTITLVPADMALNLTREYTEDELISLGERDLAYTVTISGLLSEIPLPGIYLKRLSAGKINTILVCHGADESSNNYCEIIGTMLYLTCGAEWERPVWRREITKGALISDRDRSHIADLYELELYINTRGAIDGLSSPIDISQSQYDIGAYTTWRAIILYMRGYMADILAEEGKTAKWCTITAGELPKADAINELRRYLDGTPGGAADIVDVADYGLAVHSYRGSSFGKTPDNTRVTWRAGRAPASGKNWGWESIVKDATSTIKVRVNNNHFGIWMLKALIEGKTVTSLALRLTSTDGYDIGENKIIMYPVKVQSIPNGDALVGDVVDRSVVAGELGAAPGTTVDVSLSTAFVEQLKSGTYYGVAVDPDQTRKTYTSSAQLLINQTGGAT